jgi:hypothetical protein
MLYVMDKASDSNKLTTFGVPPARPASTQPNRNFSQ